MLASAIDHLYVKEARKKEEEKAEGEFKKRLMEKFADDERLEQYNAQKRKQKEFDLKKEVIYFIKLFRSKNNGKKNLFSINYKEIKN